MSYIPIEKTCVLALDPSSKGTGFAVLEGPEQLIDWGMKVAARGDKNARCLKQVATLVEYYTPDVIVLEDYAGKGSHRCLRIQRLLSQIGARAAEMGITAYSYSRSVVQEVFAQYGAFTKYEIATAIASQLPELAPWMPPVRKCWMSEDYRMSIFDAVAFAMTFFHYENKPL